MIILFNNLQYDKSRLPIPMLRSTRPLLNENDEECNLVHTCANENLRFRLILFALYISY